MLLKMSLAGTSPGPKSNLAPNEATYFYGEINACRQFLRDHGLTCDIIGWASPDATRIGLIGFETKPNKLADDGHILEYGIGTYYAAFWKTQK
jgi:hypothetical protein